MCDLKVKLTKELIDEMKYAELIDADKIYDAWYCTEQIDLDCGYYCMVGSEHAGVAVKINEIIVVEVME